MLDIMSKVKNQKGTYNLSQAEVDKYVFQPSVGMLHTAHRNAVWSYTSPGRQQEILARKVNI